LQEPVHRQVEKAVKAVVGLVLRFVLPEPHHIGAGEFVEKGLHHAVPEDEPENRAAREVVRVDLRRRIGEVARTGQEQDIGVHLQAQRLQMADAMGHLVDLIGHAAQDGHRKDGRLALARGHIARADKIEAEVLRPLGIPLPVQSQSRE